MVSAVSIFLLLALVFSVLIFVLGFIFLLSVLVSLLFGAPYVPLSQKLVHEILSFGCLSANDILCDLGCGDGRILMSGVSDFNVSRAIGYEVAPWPYLKAMFLITCKRQKELKLFRKNCLKADIGKTTFIYLYLFPKLVDKVAYKIAHEGAPKTRVLCVEFPIDTNRHTGFQLLKSRKIANLMAYLYQLNPRNSLR